MVADDRYCRHAKFISQGERSAARIEPLSINEIKDIDSLFQAISDKWEYTGNRIMGNSSFVEDSDLVMDSSYVGRSANIQQSSCIYSSSMIRKDSRSVFGSGYLACGEFLVRVFAAFNIKRSFECLLNADSSDLYFCHNCFGCHDLMFSFSQRNARYRIGNLQLESEKYLELKRKLLSEIVLDLRRNKHYPSIFELVGSGTPQPSIAGYSGNEPDHSKEKSGLLQIENAFSTSYRVIFKNDGPGISELEGWLERDLFPIKGIRSPLGGEVFAPRGDELGPLSRIPENRLVSMGQALHLGRESIAPGMVTSIEGIREGLKSIGHFTPELAEGNGRNVLRSPIVFNSSNVYKAFDATYSEYAALCSQALNSKYVFGCRRIMDSDFCIRCFNSLDLHRCYEVDCSESCSDSLFLHDCQGVKDSMFCFGIKGAHHSIGNVRLERSSFSRKKEMILEQLCDSLDRYHSSGMDIFNIAGKGACL